MKTKLRFYSLSISFALMLGISFISCTKEESSLTPASQNQENLQLKNGTIGTTEDATCDLIGGQTINVGHVIFSHDATNLYVEYLTSGGWGLVEAHLYVGTQAGVPLAGGKNPIPGQFPFSATNLGGVTQYKFTIPLANLHKDANGYTVIAHAVVMNGDQQQTAYSNCTYNPVIVVKSLFDEGSFDSQYFHLGVTEGDPLPDYFTGPSIDPYSWCRHMGTNVYSGEATYKLVGWGTENPGEVHVSDDGSNLLVEVSAHAGYHISDTYLFVGSIQGLVALGLDTNCPNYTKFPYTSTVNPAGFSIPMPMTNSKTFKSAFGANKWGWVSVLNF